MQCPVCQVNQISRIDQCMIELYGHCWMCGKKQVDENKITIAEFRDRENAAIKKKYEED